MRSRNVSPGLEVILTLIWSDKTRVPPVTAERSPPPSRMTGADSPGIADQSTDATHSTILHSQTAFCFVAIFKTQNVLPAPISRCSRIGPRLRAGKKVNAPTIRITPMRSAVNKGVVTGKVPSEGGTYFLRAKLPAMARMGSFIKKRPASIVMAPAMLYQRVFVFRPANADPLLPACDVNE